MVRKYVRKTAGPAWSREDLAKAVQAVKSKTLSGYKAAEQFQIPRTTIMEYVRGGPRKSLSRGRPTVLSEEIEKNLAEQIRTREKYGIGLSRTELLEFVANYVKENNIKTPFKNGVPGSDWLFRFVSRHNLFMTKFGANTINEEPRAGPSAARLPSHDDRHTPEDYNVPIESTLKPVQKDDHTELVSVSEVNDETSLIDERRRRPTPSGAAADISIGPELHCNVCKSVIVGFRYTCVQCEDFDLCAKCEARAEHDHHYVLRVPAGPRPHHAEVEAVVARIRHELRLPPRPPDEELDSMQVEVTVEMDPGPDPLQDAPSFTEENEPVEETTEIVYEIKMERESEEDTREREAETSSNLLRQMLESTPSSTQSTMPVHHVNTQKDVVKKPTIAARKRRTDVSTEAPAKVQVFKHIVKLPLTQQRSYTRHKPPRHIHSH